ncbi:MAG: hypothetical protein Kow0069_20600 [Promethearchaeota archaeon]
MNESARLVSSRSGVVGNGTAGWGPVNESFFVDESHGWRLDQYRANFTDLVDQRDWVTNGGFGNDENLTADLHVDGTWSYDYGNHEDPDPASPRHQFDGNGSDYMRLHFASLEVERHYDFLCIWNQDGANLKNYSGFFYDFWTPWLPASTLKTTFSSDNMFNEAGYVIDAYEAYNGSLHAGWSIWTNTSQRAERLVGSADNATGRSSVYALVEGIQFADGSYQYQRGETVQFVQNLSVPSGPVVDAWVSLDYYLDHGIESNDFYLVVGVNGQQVFSRGFASIFQQGVGQWHSVSVNLALWENATPVLPSPLSSSTFNLSVGLKVGLGAAYSGFSGREYQKLYFDDVKLVLRSLVNATLPRVNLTVDGAPTAPHPTRWGVANASGTGAWTGDPADLLLGTNSPQLSYSATFSWSASHQSTSRVQQEGATGTTLVVSPGGATTWTFHHNVYVPPGYEDYWFEVAKPAAWTVTSVKDPTGLTTPFDFGGRGDPSVAVNSSFAGFPGWWSVTATSSNLLASAPPSVWNGTGWAPANGTGGDVVVVDVGGELLVRAQLSFADGPVPGVTATWANLTVYHANGTVWFATSAHPDAGGTVQFPSVVAGGTNASAGAYPFVVTWTNGTAAGATNGTVVFRHHAEAHAYYPKDATDDWSTSQFYGDVVPVKLLLNDTESGAPVSGAVVTCNWTTGAGPTTLTFTEAGYGFYELALDTLQLPNAGSWVVLVNATRVGYHDLSASLVLQLVEPTTLRVVEADAVVEFGQDARVVVEYASGVDGSGIVGAEVATNLSSSATHVAADAVPGRYVVTIDGEALGPPGTRDVEVSASVADGEPQAVHVGVEVRPVSVDLAVYLDGVEVGVNRSRVARARQEVNFTVEVRRSLDGAPVASGTVTLVGSNGFVANLTRAGNHHEVILNASSLGLGVTYLSALFSAPNDENDSFVLQLTVEPLEARLLLVDASPQVVLEPGSRFNATISLVDSLSGKPVPGATVTYSWVFGTGFLVDLGGGTYGIETPVPDQPGTYQIVVAVQLGDDYETATLELVLISQPVPREDPRLLYATVTAAVAATVAAVGTVVKVKVLDPRKEREREAVRELASHYYDTHAIVGYLVLTKQSGECLFDDWQESASRHLDANLLSGFLSAITSFGEQMPGTSAIADLKSDGGVKRKSGSAGPERAYRTMFFDYHDFKIQMMDGERVRVAVIFAEDPSPYFNSRLARFVEEFEDIYAFFLEEFDGRLDPFEKSAQLFNRHVHFDMTRPVELVESTKAKKLQAVGTLTEDEERVANVIRAFLKEADHVRLRTIVSLYSSGTPEEVESVVAGIVGLWLKGLLAPVDPEEVLKRAEQFFTREEEELLELVAGGLNDSAALAERLDLPVHKVDAILQGLRAWKLVDLRNHATPKGLTVLSRRREAREGRRGDA